MSPNHERNPYIEPTIHEEVEWVIIDYARDRKKYTDACCC
jgi:hypothetical protein